MSRSQQWHRRNLGDGSKAHLDIRIHTHVTQRRSNIVTHVYCWLLEMFRTNAHPESPLAHLLNPTQLGNPDFVTSLDQHYVEIKQFVLDISAKQYTTRLTELVAEGAVKLPNLQVLDGGLAAIEQGLRRLREGDLAGEKLVVSLSAC